MASNTFNDLASSVNEALAQMATATSGANGAAASATEQTEAAQTAAGTANSAAETAETAASRANTEAAKWEGATVAATALEAGSTPTCTLTESGGVKKFTFGIPRGATGATGAKGATGPAGKSGVTFSLSGTTLTITTTA